MKLTPPSGSFMTLRTFDTFWKVTGSGLSFYIVVTFSFSSAIAFCLRVSLRLSKNGRIAASAFFWYSSSVSFYGLTNISLYIFSSYWRLCPGKLFDFNSTLFFFSKWESLNAVILSVTSCASYTYLGLIIECRSPTEQTWRWSPRLGRKNSFVALFIATFAGY